jgi:hypothetical protein
VNGEEGYVVPLLSFRREKSSKEEKNRCRRNEDEVVVVVIVVQDDCSLERKELFYPKVHNSELRFVSCVCILLVYVDLVVIFAFYFCAIII